MKHIERNLIPLPDVKTAFFGRNAGTKALVNDQTFADTEIFTMEQTHSATVSILYPGTPNPIPSSDGVFTTFPGLTLAVKTADCVPVLLYHPSGIIGALHAGRRGLEKGIVEKAAQILKNTFDVTETVYIWIGPAICKDCYQVDREQNLYYDLHASVLEQLHDVFEKKALQITAHPGCTLHDSEQFYSYRKSGKGVSMNWSAISFA